MIDRIIDWLVKSLDIALVWFSNVYASLGLDFMIVVMCMVVATIVVKGIVSPMLGSGSSDVVNRKMEINRMKQNYELRRSWSRRK